jgi:4-aminobutyrate aminotransferase-like enzyme
MLQTTNDKRNLSSVDTDRFKNILTAAAGYKLRFNNERVYIDVEVGGSACLYGFNDPELLAAKNRIKPSFIRNELDETSEDIQAVLAKLTKHSGLEGVAWACSGSDAVEAAIAINDAYWTVHDPKRTQIVTFDSCYHGTTYLTKSLRGPHKRKVPWVRNQLLYSPKWVNADQGVIQEQCALERLTAMAERCDDIGAVLIESMPWNDGYYPWSQYFMTSLRDICDRYNFNLIIDDVAIGFGKFGQIFTHSAYNIVPDIVATGKAVTNGYVPFGFAMANHRCTNAVKSLDNWSQIHTWCPSVDAVAVTRVMLEKLEKDLYRVPELSSRFQTMASDLNLPVRGHGLMWEIIKAGADITKFTDLGLYSEHGIDKSIKFIIPLIADDEYFATVSKALENLWL